MTLVISIIGSTAQRNLLSPKTFRYARGGVIDSPTKTESRGLRQWIDGIDGLGGNFDRRRHQKGGFNANGYWPSQYLQIY